MIRSVDMSPPVDLVAHLLARLHQVRTLLGLEPLVADAKTRFADALDSMGLVEFLSLVAEDCGVPIEAIEQATGHRYSTIGEFAVALDAAGARVSRHHHASGTPALRPLETQSRAWLAATAVALPVHRQSASAINPLLGRPSGWLEGHAGIEARCLWGDADDPLDAAARATQDCLHQAGLAPAEVGALLVTSEAPPLPVGLAVALHARLGLPSNTVALEIGAACTGFLAAMWTAQYLLTNTAAVAMIAVEAPSRWLTLSKSAPGEAAALFGDAAAACLFTSQPMGADALCLRDIVLGTNGTAGSLLRVEMRPGGRAELHMDGIALAHRAVRAMSDAVLQLCARHDLRANQLSAVIAHGGNGRMSTLLARRLGLPPQRVLSETARTGNLGSASLPVAWCSRDPSVAQPVIWTAVGAGLQWGAALLDTVA
jgi:3-oxoacyl-[acyl-carrier-protein] synthase-3